MISPRGFLQSVKDRVVKVRRDRFWSSLRSSDVFLVAYPRSGTTWLGFMMANALMNDHDEPLTVQSFSRHVPDINEEFFDDGSLHRYSVLPDPRVFTVHAQYDPHFPKVVYIVRDPRDVMVSYWHFKRLMEPKFSMSQHEFFKSNTHWPCRWDEHVSGWMLQHKHPNMLVVRYEEMRRDTLAVFSKILEFSGIQPHKDKMEKAIKEASFEKMQAIESQFGFALDGAQGLRGEHFIRRGQIGGWKDELDEKSLRILEDKLSPVMELVGYKRWT